MHTTELRRRSRRFFGLLAVATATATLGNVAPSAAAGPSLGSVVSDPNACATASFATYQPFNDPYAMYRQMPGAQTYQAAGFTGAGIDVAVIDTGVTPVAGLQGVGKVVHGPDLSFESQTDYDALPGTFAHLDTYGHGTHMAGIIAGNDPATGFKGIAPDARIVSLKVADSQGAVDVTQVIAAIDWVVAHKSDPTIAGGLNIRVLNLSLGMAGTGSSDVLNYAADQAWQAGIVVVASTGNDGVNAGVQSPANSPQVLAVGAFDPVTRTATEFTSGASGSREPDILAPGRSVPSLHVPGSYSDDEIEKDCRDNIAAGRAWFSPILGANKQWVRGSGTSQAAAMMSGAAALILDKAPTLAPSDLKWLVRRYAMDIAASTDVGGKGALNLGAVFTATNFDRNHHDPGVDGGGTLQAARGGFALPCLSEYSVQLLRGTFGYYGWQGGVCSAFANMTVEERTRRIESDIFGAGFDSKSHAIYECVDPATQSYCMNTRRNPMLIRPWSKTLTGEMWRGRTWVGLGTKLDQATGQWMVNTTNWSASYTTAKDWLGTPWSGKTWRNSTWDGKTWRHTPDGKTWRTGSWLGSSWVGKTWRDQAWR